MDDLDLRRVLSAAVADEPPLQRSRTMSSPPPGEFLWYVRLVRGQVPPWWPLFSSPRWR